MKDLTPYIPAEFRACTPHLEMTDAAVAEALAFVDAENVILPVVAHSTSTYNQCPYQRREWFQVQPVHPICTAARSDGATLTLAYDHTKGVLLSLSEVTLPEDYYERRVVEETIVEYFL